MKDQDFGIAVTEHSVRRGVRSKSLESVRVMKPKLTSPQRHARSMPDSRGPAIALRPLPARPGAPSGLGFHPHDSTKTHLIELGPRETGKTCTFRNTSNRS